VREDQKLVQATVFPYFVGSAHIYENHLDMLHEHLHLVVTVDAARQAYGMDLSIRVASDPSRKQAQQQRIISSPQSNGARSGRSLLFRVAHFQAEAIL